MDPVIKAQWEDDLRSGRYRQGRGALKTWEMWDGKPIGVKHCCLGVLCEQAKAAGVVIEIENNGNTRFKGVEDGVHVFGEEAVLPGPVAEWAGLRSRNPKIDDDPDSLDTLAGANDSGMTFAQIAEIIHERF